MMVYIVEKMMMDMDDMGVSENGVRSQIQLTSLIANMIVLAGWNAFSPIFPANPLSAIFDLLFPIY